MDNEFGSQSSHPQSNYFFFIKGHKMWAFELTQKLLYSRLVIFFLTSTEHFYCINNSCIVHSWRTINLIVVYLYFRIFTVTLCPFSWTTVSTYQTKLCTTVVLCKRKKEKDRVGMVRNTSSVFKYHQDMVYIYIYIYIHIF